METRSRSLILICNHWTSVRMTVHWLAPIIGPKYQATFKLLRMKEMNLKVKMTLDLLFPRRAFSWPKINKWIGWKSIGVDYLWTTTHLADIKMMKAFIRNHPPNKLIVRGRQVAMVVEFDGKINTNFHRTSYSSSSPGFHILCFGDRKLKYGSAVDIWNFLFKTDICCFWVYYYTARRRIHYNLTAGYILRHTPLLLDSYFPVLFPPPPFPLGLQWTPVDSGGLHWTHWQKWKLVHWSPV